MVDFSVLKKARFSDLTKWNVAELLSNKVLGKYENQPLIKFLIRAKNAIEIKDDVLYKQITIHQFGAGVSLRCEKYGKEIGTKRQFVAKKGQFIISRIDARNGSFGIVPDFLDGAIVTNDFWLFDIKNADADFLRLLFSSKKINSFWQSKSNGTTNRQRVDFADFMKSTLPIPPLEEQKTILQKYQESIIQAEKLEKQADDFFCESHSYFDKILEIEDIKPNLKSGLNFIQYKNIDFWGVDKNACRKTIRNKKYKTVPLETLCSVGSGGTPSRIHPEYYKEGNIPWVKTTEVIDELISDTEEKITKKGLNSSSAKLYEPNSLIIAMYGQGQTRGRTAKLAIQATTNQACAVLHDIDTKQVDIDYLWFYFQNEYERIRELASGNNQPNLNAGMIKTYPIVLPPLPIQEEIVNHINQIKTQIKELRKQAQELREKAKKDFEGSVFE